MVLDLFEVLDLKGLDCHYENSCNITLTSHRNRSCYFKN